MSYNELFSMELIDLDVSVANQIDFFKQSSKKLLETGKIEESFESAIINREEMYPTGLNLENFSIAIPHTDVIHVKEPFVFVNRLINPIKFYQMGTDDQVVKVKDIFILGIKNPKNQVGLLSSMMDIFANKEFVSKYKKTTSVEDIYKLINNYL